MPGTFKLKNPTSRTHRRSADHIPRGQHCFFLGGTYEKTPNQKLDLPDAADMKIVRPVLWRGEAVPHFCGRGDKKAPEIR